MISVIVPVYNASKYLKECILSILSQSYFDFELILVDDGSTDDSFLICKTFAKTDKRIKIFQKQNGGQGSARNLGVSNCRGEFISFIDADDIISSNFLETLINDINKYDADLVVCRSVHFKDGEAIQFNKSDCDPLLLSRNEAFKIRFLDDGRISDSPCNKLFKKSIIQYVPFLENRFLEDSAFFYKYLYLSKNVLLDTRTSYFVRENINSESRKRFTPRRLDTIKTYKEMRIFVMNHSNIGFLLPYVNERICGAIYYNCGEFLLSDNKDRSIRKSLKNEAKDILSHIKDLSFKNKLLLVLIIYVPFVYKILYKRRKR